MDLCLTLTEKSSSALGEKLRRYSGRVAFLEARLDFLEEPGRLPELPPFEGTEIIATCRPPREGGHFSGSEHDRLQILSAASQAGCQWVDLEYDVAPVPALAPGTRLIRSCHRLQDFPSDLKRLFQDVRSLPGHLTKLALSVPGTAQLAQLLTFLEGLSDDRPHLVLGMGTYGQPSRILGPFLGNRWTYVSEGDVPAAAPGQFSLYQAENWYRLPSWKSAPVFLGVLGNPVSHSLSPPLHNLLFRRHGLDLLYLPLPATELDPWFSFVASTHLSFRGFSVTLPFKSDVVRFLRQVNSPVGSVNTLLRAGEGWEGYNTDYPGFLEPLQQRLQPAGKTAVVLGTGGVAHTVVKALQDAGMRVTLVGRSREKLNVFQETYRCSIAQFGELPISADLCVNTTPVGQYPKTEESLLQENQLAYQLVYDLVYYPERTRLLAAAERSGAQTLSGLDMFVGQAARQFQKWTGIDPDREWMKECVRGLLQAGTPQNSAATAAGGDSE